MLPQASLTFGSARCSSRGVAHSSSRHSTACQRWAKKQSVSTRNSQSTVHKSTSSLCFSEINPLLVSVVKSHPSHVDMVRGPIPSSARSCFHCRRGSAGIFFPGGELPRLSGHWHRPSERSPTKAGAVFRKLQWYCFNTNNRSFM